jgi:hypothetical protein
MHPRIACFVCVAACLGIAAAVSADEPQAAVHDAAATATAHLEAELVRNTDVQYLDTQLGDVVNDLELRHKIEIELDVAALAADGKLETPITKTISKLPLNGTLNHLLRDKYMAWYVRDGILMITTAKAARAITETTVFSVAGLALGDGEPDYAAIETVVEAIVFRAAGVRVNRTLRSHRSTKTLVVATNPLEQREVERLIGEMHEAMRYEGERRVLPLPTEAEAKIDQVLAGPGELQYLDTQLGDVRADLEVRYGIHIELDEEGIKDAGNDGSRGAEALVNYACKNVALGPALERALDPLGLTWTRDEISVIVTSKLLEPSFQVRRIYRVGDLANSAEDYDELAKLIRNTVAADTWRSEQVSAGPDPVGAGPGEMATFRPAQAIVVTQTARTHRAIEKLLDDLRGAKKEK